MVALPITNLYLQGHDGPGRVSARSRRSVRCEPVVSRCVPVPTICETRSLTRSAGLTRWKQPALSVVAAHQSPHGAVDLVTGDVRRVLGLGRPGRLSGARADFLAVRGTDVVDVIAAAPPTGS